MALAVVGLLLVARRLGRRPLPQTKTSATPGRSRRSRWTARASPTTSRGSYGARDALQHGLRLERPPQTPRRASAAARPASPTTPAPEPACASSRWPAARVAWIVNQGGNRESGDYLYASLVARARASGCSRPRSAPATSAAILTGNWLGGLVGAGSVPRGRPLGDGLWAASVNRRACERVGARLDDLAQGRGDDDRAVDGRPSRSPFCAGRQRRDLLDAERAAADGPPQLGEGGRAARRLPRRPDEGANARGLQLALRPATAHVARRARRALQLDISSGWRLRAPFPAAATHRRARRAPLDGQDRVLRYHAAAAGQRRAARAERARLRVPPDAGPTDAAVSCSMPMRRACARRRRPRTAG